MKRIDNLLRVAIVCLGLSCLFCLGKPIQNVYAEETPPEGSSCHYQKDAYCIIGKHIYSNWYFDTITPTLIHYEKY